MKRMVLQILETLSLVAFVALGLAAAHTPTEEWERRGNDAFAAGRYDEAAVCFEQALATSQEPVRVVHNHAVALFHLGRYRDAEKLFRAAVHAGDPGPIRARAHYDLGTCLLFAAEGRDLARATAAMQNLHTCVQLLAEDDALRAQATFNLELARRTWRKLSDDPPPAEKAPPPDSGNGDQSKDPMNSAGNEPNGSGQNTGRGTSMALPAPSEGPKPMPMNERHPGAGSQGVLPDSEQNKPMTPAEARDQLRQAIERMTRERQALLRSGTGVNPRSFPDW